MGPSSLHSSIHTSPLDSPHHPETFPSLNDVLLCPYLRRGHPSPVADTCNEPCVRQCPDSTVVIQPPASVVTFPGPILSSFPQHSAVGSAGAPYVGGGFGGSSGRRGGSGGSGGSGGFGGYGGFGGFGGSCGGSRGCGPC
ncbi:uncharacterized protein GJ701_016004 [Geothlypis trichas]